MFLRKNTDMSCSGISQAAVSRGKLLVERVVKEQVSRSLSCLVCLWMNSVQLSWVVYQYFGFLLSSRNVFRLMGSWQMLWNGGSKSYMLTVLLSSSLLTLALLKKWDVVSVVHDLLCLASKQMLFHMLTRRNQKSLQWMQLILWWKELWVVLCL